MRSLNRREHVLLLIAVLIAAGMGYSALRVRPADARLARIETRTALFRDRLKNAEWPKAEDPEALSAVLSRLTSELEADRNHLADLEARFVPRGQSGELEELLLQISALADRHAVQFRENTPCPTATLRRFLGPHHAACATEAADLIRFLTLGEPYTRPVRQVTLDATFQGLRGFLRDLGALPQLVVIACFEIEAAKDPLAGQAPLRAKLLLVF